MIQIRNLYKSFKKVKVLSDLDLDIKDRGIFAVLGPNGSGKTTLIKCVLGMVIPDSGSILIDDAKVLGKYNYRNDINYLPQIARFPNNLKVSELFRMIKETRPKVSDAQQLIDEFDLEEVMNKKLGILSGGTKQKVNLALTFMFDSPIIILDEPTTGLDPISLMYLKKLIIQEKQKGKTILITSHIMSFVEEISDEIVFLLDGKIYFKGTVEALKEQTKQVNLEHSIASLMKLEHV
jgi:Cu-processing system ATP-binding protein